MFQDSYECGVNCCYNVIRMILIVHMCVHLPVPVERTVRSSEVTKY